MIDLDLWSPRTVAGDASRIAFDADFDVIDTFRRSFATCSRRLPGRAVSRRLSAWTSGVLSSTCTDSVCKHRAANEAMEVGPSKSVAGLETAVDGCQPSACTARDVHDATREFAVERPDGGFSPRELSAADKGRLPPLISRTSAGARSTARLQDGTVETGT